MARVLTVAAVVATAEIAAPIILLEAAGAGVTTLAIEAAPVDPAVLEAPQIRLPLSVNRDLMC